MAALNSDKQLPKLSKQQAIMRDIEAEAETIMGTKRYKRFYEHVFTPLMMQESDMEEIKAVLRAINDVASSEGVTYHLEE